MIYRFISVSVFVCALTLVASSAHAIGVYADVPMQYTFSDCTTDCTFTPSGMKAGVIIMDNIGLGLEAYTITSSTGGSNITFTMLDASYLLPIPVVNITLGAGVGNVKLNSGGSSESGMAAQLWASFGFTIAAIVDVHVGYHQVNAKIHVNEFTFDLGGNMISLGAMINF